MLHALYNLESCSLHGKARLRSIVSPQDIGADHLVFVPVIRYSCDGDNLDRVLTDLKVGQRDSARS